VEKNKCTYIPLMWKPEGKRSLGRPGSEWEINNKTYLIIQDWKV
jgi:hypothetical protein